MSLSKAAMRLCLLVVGSLLCGACAAGTTDASAKTKTYTGPFSAQVVESTVTTSLQGGGTFPCTNTYTMSGVLSMKIDQAGSAIAGSAQIVGTQKETAHSSASSCIAKGDLSILWAPALSGTTSDLRFADQYVSNNGNYAVTNRTSFAGTLSGGVVTGVLGFSVSGTGTIGTGSIVQNYSSTMSVTLQ
jgi:hypothetical protein